MKKITIAAISFFILVSFLSANETIFKSLQFSAVMSINLDTVLTYEALWNHGAREGNPIVASYIKNVPLTVGIDFAINTALLWGTSKLYKKNKPLSYAIVIGVNLIQAYCFYLHYRLRQHSWR